MLSAFALNECGVMSKGQMKSVNFSMKSVNFGMIWALSSEMLETNLSLFG